MGSRLTIPDDSNLHPDINFRTNAKYGENYNASPFNADMPRGSGNNEYDDELKLTATSKRGVKSLFNQYSLYSGAGDNVLVDEDIRDASDYLTPTAANLVNNSRGHVVYNYADFAYCSMYGKVPNNRLITLRRFARPIQDDITDTIATPAPEVSRLITWFDGETNRLEDILNWSYNMKWKSLSASVEQGHMAGGGSNSGVNGWMATMSKFLDPKFANEAMEGSARLSIAPNHDHNAVYGPIDSITETHIRDIGLNFSNEFTLTFLYSIKSIDGINAKSAMIDLLSNVLSCTYNNAKFWGGARYWTGPRPSKFWDTAFQIENALIADGMDKGFNNIMQYVQGAIKDFMSKPDPIGTLTQIASAAFKKFTIAKLINTIGRPSIPVMSSLLRGDAIGDWHIMIGNPLRPIVCMGNMIVTKAAIQPLSSNLGYDDFPTDYKVTISLKHAMPRDKAGIESMMTAGKGRTYWKPTDDTFNAEFKPAIKTKYNTANDTNANAISSMIDKVYETVHDFVSNTSANADVNAINAAKTVKAKSVD